MLDVYWLEQTEADVPAEDDWLGASEVLRLDGLHFAKRRADWRLGRWTAKRALAFSLNLPGHSEGLAGIEIRAAPSGAPEVFLANRPAGITLSLSHRGGSAACAVVLSGSALGCDLEIVEPRSKSFFDDYFTAEEQALVAREPVADRSRLLALLWSAKESTLKALREGLRLDTRCVSVSPGASRPVESQSAYQCHGDSVSALPLSGLNSWWPLQVRCTNGQLFSGWWQQTGNLVRTLVAAPSPAPPILLKAPPHCPQVQPLA